MPTPIVQPIDIAPAFIIWPWVLIGIMAFIFAFSCMAVARAKGYNPLSWWFIGFVLGILGLVILACFPSRR